jgi:hypothetical protein
MRGEPTTFLRSRVNLGIVLLRPLRSFHAFPSRIALHHLALTTIQLQVDPGLSINCLLWQVNHQRELLSIFLLSTLFHSTFNLPSCHPRLTI